MKEKLDWAKFNPFIIISETLIRLELFMKQGKILNIFCSSYVKDYVMNEIFNFSTHHH